MKPAVVEQLRLINREFYQQFAAEYSDSRRALQPGLPRALGALGDFDSLLDLGCGDGRIGWSIAEGLLDRPLELYVGVDASTALLNQRGGLPPQLKSWQAVIADFCEPDWPAPLQHYGRFDAACCFSALHHLPSRALRIRFLRAASELLVDGARFAVSVWQLSHQPRFEHKRVAWSEIGLAPEQLEPGDLLVDWQRGGAGLRYIHEFTADELIGEVEDAGFVMLENWRSDGRSEDLGLYVIARK